MAFLCLCFFFNDTATTEIYTLSLHDALPILPFLADETGLLGAVDERNRATVQGIEADQLAGPTRSEEHTSELQSH